MFSQLSLKFRIALVILLLEAVMMTFVLWPTLSQSKRSAEAFHTATENVLLGLMQEIATGALLTEEYSDLQLYVAKVAAQPSVERILVTDTNGKVVASSDATEVGQSPPEQLAAKNRFWRTVTVESAAGTLGEVIVEFSTADIEEANRRARNLGAALAIIGMSAIAAIGILVGFALTRRLERVTAAVTRFAQGDVNARSGVTGRDEIGGLGQVFDSMAAVVSTQQKQLREQADRIRLLLDSTAEAIYGVDLNGKCTFVNPACVSLLGYSEEAQLLGQPMHQLIHHSHPDGSPYPREKCRIFNAERNDRTVRCDEEVFWRADGTALPAEYWAHPIHQEGKVVGHVVAFVDITARKSTEAELKRHRDHLEDLVAQRTAALRRMTEELAATNMELQSFSYSVSHDLRAPLRAIDGFSHALEADYGAQLDEGAKNYLRRIRAGAQKMGRLIDDLLQLAQVSRQELRRANVDLSALAAVIIANLREAEPQRQVRADIAPGLVVKGDPGLLQVMLENLLGNAWKYTSQRDEAEITFGSRDENGERIYFVRDNGAGFDMRYADKLFGAFQRLHRPDEFEGTGIGLATVQRVLARHGGRIWPEAEPDRGATFYFVIPNVEVDTSSAQVADMTDPDNKTVDRITRRDARKMR